MINGRCKGLVEERELSLQGPICMYLCPHRLYTVVGRLLSGHIGVGREI